MLKRSAVLIGFVVVAGCGGGGTSPAPVAPPQVHIAAKSAQVTFTMHWNSATTSSVRRVPKFVSPSALSVSVIVNQGVPQVLNFPQTTLTVNAPVGTDLFVFQTYDEANGQGDVLGTASISQSIVDGVANTVSAVLDGVIASLAMSLGNPTPNAGAAATTSVNVAALDAGGNTIVGSSDYSTPITLTITDPANSGSLSLSKSFLQSPASTATLHYNGGTLVSATLTASTTGVPSVSATIAPTPTFYAFSIPTASSYPAYITAGPDGNMWFTERGGNKIGRITAAGTVTEFTVPTSVSNPVGIIKGSDGRLWFTEYNASKIGAVTTTGSFTEYATAFSSDGPWELVDRGDGNIWYTGSAGNHISYVAINGGYGEGVTIPTGTAVPFGITTAPDNNIYFTESNVAKIGRTPNAATVPTEVSVTAGSDPVDCVRGPDGHIWFTELINGAVGELAPSSFSLIAEFPTLTPTSYPRGITVGGDGALWFVESGVDKIGRVTTAGVMTEYSSPVTGLALFGIAAAPNGSLWFTESGVNKIGELVY